MDEPATVTLEMTDEPTESRPVVTLDTAGTSVENVPLNTADTAATGATTSENEG